MNPQLTPKESMPTSVRRKVRCFAKQDDGAAQVEYALLALLILGIAIAVNGISLSPVFLQVGEAMDHNSGVETFVASSSTAAGRRIAKGSGNASGVDTAENLKTDWDHVPSVILASLASFACYRICRGK